MIAIVVVIQFAIAYGKFKARSLSRVTNSHHISSLIIIQSSRLDLKKKIPLSGHIISW
ncbi:MAG: hypothetical protein KME28_04715 [Pelatocladus maniniholoensis HA4357-MV3]|uniref:Uncharacterized protein n=1 Tax=Pelatocladus maniniholoensis HA4357-MV3 TaxID=1117104 RepID=A0A9E3H532_9NOST|nr:hypothetical protein [Pelatocladus maniniholoensis HA4357-MV3]